MISFGRLYAAVLCALLFAATSYAGSLNIRVIQASNNGQGISGDIADIQPLLKSNLPFSRFDLLGAQTTALPASGQVQLAGGFTLKCSGPQNNLSVELSRNGRALLSTVLALQAGKPVILGGVPSGENKLLVVLVAQ